MIKFLNEIEEPNVSELGGKGYSLAVLMNHGFNVPKGFVITSEVFFKFLKENNLLETIEKLTSEINESNFQEKSGEIRNLILKGKISDKIISEIKQALEKLNVKYVSIRSSAVSEDSLKASFAGLHDTFLNVRAEIEPVLENVKKCWASLFNDRAVIYRIKKKIPHLEGMAVIIQEMIPAEISGITFTIHPTNKRVILIEFTSEIGETIVSGKVIPSSATIDRGSLLIKESNDLIIDEKKLIEIAKTCLKIEEVFGKPQDIEWCIQNDEVYILQSRSITTDKFSNHKRNKEREIRSIKGLGASSGKAKGRVKVIHNIQQLHKIRDGDILVAPMTNPDMVLAMSKCVGIVTDSGGMICHAAIISRELGIPCVVGTGIATQVLKDNMLVEVDGTRGIVHIIESPEQTSPNDSEGETIEYFTIFGNKVKPIKLKIVRKHPMYPKIWDYPWPSINFEECFWICPRPEIYGSFVQRSLISAGIEQIPFSLGFDDIGPLYVRYYDNVYIHFEKTKEIIRRLREKLLGADPEFWNNFIKRLKRAYEKFDKKTEDVKSKIGRDRLGIDELINIFEEWWKVHNEFFSTTYLIQAMGDDIIWPKIGEILENVFKDRDKVLEYVKILSAPIIEKEIVTSTKFALETYNLIEYNEVIRKLIESNLEEKVVLEIIRNLDYGQEWIEKLTEHVQKWGWVRERDPYFDPISDKIGMIKFIRKYAPKEPLRIDLQKNIEMFSKVISELKQKLPPELFEKLRFYIMVGRVLHKERDDHHYIWIKNTSIVRKIILTFGKKLYKLGIIENKKDVFFLTLPEILYLLREPPLKEHIVDIREKINKRMAHLKKMTKVEFHKKTDEKLAPQYFDDIF